MTTFDVQGKQGREPTFGAGSLCFVLVVVLGILLLNFDPMHERVNSNDTAAIGALKTIQAAQELFRLEEIGRAHV